MGKQGKLSSKAINACKMDGNSLCPQKELAEFLKVQFPSIFTDGKVDVQKLKQTLGEQLDTSGERYGLNWAGKNECFRHIQEPTTATLKPCKKEGLENISNLRSQSSENKKISDLKSQISESENIFIEGDNLQVLKVLQKSYYGEIKMIYIDPPYNTGNDSFIYPDRFKEEKESYELRANIKDVEGNLIKDGFWRKNSKDAGHFHSNWLSMIYPRLFLARNLLAPDGVIFVSIDDNEAHNLRMMMNEIFGEESFIAQFIIKSNPRGSQSTKNSAIVHDYLLCFCRNAEAITQLQHELTPKMKEEYSEVYVDGRKCRLLGLRQRGGAWRRQDRRLLFYPIYVNPKTGKVALSKSKEYSVKVLPIQPTTGQEGTWRWNKKKVEQNSELLIAKQVKRNDELEWDISQYDFLETENGEDRKTKPKTIWDGKNVNYERGTEEVKQLFDNVGIFDFPKPVSFVTQILQTVRTGENDIILDFFAGSCTTAHAVMQLNAEDGGNRRFICVQMAEPCEEDSEAFKAGFKTIADIGKERIRRAAKKIKKEIEGNLKFDKNKLDLGFKMLRLDESNFKVWRSDVKTAEQLEKQMLDFVDNVKPDANMDSTISPRRENILYELILKTGLDLNVSIENKKANGQSYYSLDGGKLVICLEDKISKKLVDAILKGKPEKAICLDRAFENNDQLKTNTILQMEAEKIEFKVI